MKGFKKLTSIAVAITMVVTICAVNPSANAQAAVKFRYGKKLDINIGGSDVIVVKGKAVYTSSNKKIATVNSKGKVKAKKAGVCNIIVKVGNSKAKATVNVRPKKVTIKSAALTSTYANSAKVKWKKVTGASGYYVYYSANKKSGYKKVNVKGGSKTSVTIKNLTLGKTYYFKIKSYAKSGKKAVTSKDYSKVMSVKTWKLAWAEEFNGNALDMNTWTYEVGTGNNGWGNQEYQYYTAGDNIKFENGSLVIIPRMVINKNTGKTSFTSTRIKTKGKKEFKYGKIEIRAKATKAQGTWSAGWMLGNGTGDNRGWPYDGEIDIMEAMNGGVPQTIHCEYFNNQSWSHGNKNYSTGLTQAKCAEAYHTYGIIWTDRYIQFTVDGVNKGLYDPSQYDQRIWNQCWAFDHPFFFILNCAIGGNAAGNVSANGWTLKSNQNNIQTYEDYYYIDYIRVFQ